MVEFKVPEFVNYGQRVTLQVNMAKILNVTFSKLWLTERVENGGRFVRFETTKTCPPKQSQGIWNKMEQKRP